MQISLDYAEPHRPAKICPASIRKGLWCALLGLAIAISLVLWYRDEIKALVFLPGLLAAVGLGLTSAGIIRYRSRLWLLPLVVSLFINIALLAATGLLLYWLSRMW
jgi:hypothetical protein